MAAPAQQGAPQPAPPPPSVAAVAAPSDPFAIPATDDGLPGTGPIRRMEWFQNLWKQRRSQWSTQVQRDQGAVVVENRQVSVTAEKIAINAVLAGCKPEYMPVVVAAAEALGDPLYGYHGPGTSTGGSACS